jgi:hypothetical protein
MHGSRREPSLKSGAFLIQGMVLNRTIQVRMTLRQYEEIALRKETAGFETLSDYMRHCALRKDDVLHQRVKEIHQHLIPPETKKKKFKPNPMSPS